MAVELSFCVVNTEQRELLARCLDAIAAERETLAFETEVLVLDNASHDGSAAAARRHPLAPEVIALNRRAGKGENDTALLKRARGRYALLLERGLRAAARGGAGPARCAGGIRAASGIRQLPETSAASAFVTAETDNRPGRDLPAKEPDLNEVPVRRPL